MRKLLELTIPISIRHSEQYFNQKGEKKGFLEIGTAKEKHIKSIMTFSGNIRSHFEDLYLTTKFLKVDRNKISLLYDDKIEQDIYYKYHFDNFIIRIMTSIDICGKIGNIVFDLKIKDKYCNWHTFATHKKIKDIDPGKKLVQFSEYIDEFKILRHSKLHKGKTPKNKYDDVIFWDNINFTDTPIDPILNTLTDDQLTEHLKSIDDKLDGISKRTVDFLDSMTYKLIEINEN